MSLGNPRPENSQSHPGEPGVGVDLAPPFTASDESTGWLFSLNRFGIRPGLMRIQGLLKDLGNPEQDLRTLVIGGTNGKGSTTRILAHLLQDAGYKVVTFTSPHLLNVHERILINDVAIDAEDFARRVEKIRPLTEKHQASWFETLTALAAEVAMDEGADFFCCEVGLGGRLDATNALPAQAVLLTTVGLDHEAILGDTLPQIAAEKLGLLKKGVPLFCAVDEELRPQVFETSVKAGSPVFFLDELARWNAQSTGGRPEPWDIAFRTRLFENLPDPGAASMRRNLALSLLSLSELESRWEEKLLPEDISRSLGNLFLPGRYQRLLRGPDFIFDTAHNEQALTGALRHFRREEAAGRRVVFFGSMYNKELEKLPAESVAGFDVMLGAPVSIPRSRTTAELETLFQAWGLKPLGAGSDSCTLVVENIRSGLTWLAENLEENDRVLVTGSCFMVAEVLYQLGFTNLDLTREEKAASPVLAGLVDQT